MESLGGLQGITFRRCVMPLEFNGRYMEFHIFADASMNGYGAVVYLRCVSLKGWVTCRLLISKSHVSPVRQHGSSGIYQRVQKVSYVVSHIRE